MEEINEDDALITQRKKNLLLIDGNAYISKEYLDVKDFSNALEYTNKIISIDSTSFRGYYSRGCVYQGMNSDSLATGDYSKALVLNSEYADAFYNRALIYEKQGKTDLALADFDQVARLKPSYIVDVYNSRGKIYLEKESYDKALEEYNKVITIDTVDAKVYYNRAEAYYNLKDQDKAFVDYNKSISLDSTNVLSYLKRASIYLDKKDYDEALADYKKVLHLDPLEKYTDRDEIKAMIKKIKPLVKK